MPSIEQKIPSGRPSGSIPAPVPPPNSEITPSMSTISSGLSLPGPVGVQSHKGSLARIQVGPGNLPESIAASKAPRRHRRWSLEQQWGPNKRPTKQSRDQCFDLPSDEPAHLAHRHRHRDRQPAERTRSAMKLELGIL